MSKNQIKPYSHLTLNDRIIIQTAIENKATKVAIASTLAKDASTIAKEIKLHRIKKPSKRFSINGVNVQFTCSRRDRSPGACNGCDSFKTCKEIRFFYDAQKAHASYLYTLKDSREGVNLTTSERKRIAMILKPLIEKKQSINQILINHPEITLSNKSLYNYIDQGVFHEFGLINLSLKEKVNRKVMKDKYKKRKQPVSYTGHTFLDFQVYQSEHLDTQQVEMDTLYNSPSGPYLQTFIFPTSNLMFGFLRKEKTSEAMSSSLTNLERVLGASTYKNHFHLLLTDRGSEFQMHHLFEFNQKGEQRSFIFYCDPMCSYQKPHVECNHNYVRDILPNGTSMDQLTQKDIERMFTHINNTPRKVLGNRTPIEIFQFLNPKDGKEVLEKLKLKQLEPDEVNLNPMLIKTK